MNNPDSPNTNEEKGFKAQNIGGHLTYTAVSGDHNTTNVSVSGDVKVNEQTLSKLDPAFQSSITDFTNKLSEKLKEHKEITQEQINVITENTNKLAKEIEGINVGKEIEDEGKKEDITTRLTNLVEAIVEVAPAVAEYIASVSPLAPVSKSIGKSVEYVSNLIKRKLVKK